MFHNPTIPVNWRVYVPFASTVDLPKSAKLREFRQSNFELSFQTKMRQFRCFYCSNVGGFRKQCDESKRNFAAWDEFSFRRTKRNIVLTKRNFAPTKQNFVQVERNFVCRNEISSFKNWLADYRIITSCKRICTCKHDHYLKKKHRNDCYNCGENLRQNGAFWLVASLLLSQHNFVVNVSLANTCISTISLKLSIACWFTL